MSRRVVVVTGASSGIGAACADAFATTGTHLLLVARREERLAAAARRLAARGVAATPCPLDVRDRHAVEGWAGQHDRLLREVDVLVNAAGLARGFAPLHEGDVDDWDEMIDANVKGLLHVTRAVVPHMVRRGAGHVVNVGSTAGRWVYPKGAVYCATKHAERAITEGLRMDLVGTGVRVTTVDPGMVETEFSLVRFHGDAERASDVYRGMTPLTPADVAQAISWSVERPPHVTIAEVVLMPTDQASPTLVHRRES